MTTTAAPTSDSSVVSPGRSRSHLVGVVLSVLLGAFFVFDVVGKLLQPASVVEATEKLGFDATQATVMAIVLAVCVILWAVPRTTVLGAIALSAYLGGAVATNWNADKPLVSTTLFAVYVGVALWIAMFLRRPQLLSVLGFRSAHN